MSIYDIYNHKLIEFISEKKCDLSNSNLSNIDENIFIFTHLEVVDLSENFLVKISENIQKLINLKSLIFLKLSLLSNFLSAFSISSANLL